MKILITGSTGFIGSHVTRLALEAGHEVVPVTEAEWMGAPEKIQWGDAFIHLAAAGVKPPNRSWPVCLEVNFLKVIGLLDALKASGQTPTVLLAQTIREFETESRPELWKDSYVVTKKLAAQYAAEWNKTYKGNLILHVIHRCYGPGEVEIVAERILAHFQ